MPALEEKQAKAEKVDGRRERTKRTRAAIVEALTALLDEGRIEPTAAEIAGRAGVAVRSIAQHFASREELLLAVAEHHTTRLRALQAGAAARGAKRSESGDGGAPGGFEERVRRFVAERAPVLESSRAMRGAAAVVLADSPSVARALDGTARGRRKETADLFAPELAQHADPGAAERTLALVTSGRAWDAMRGEMGMGVKGAREQMAKMVKLALGRV